MSTRSRPHREKGCAGVGRFEAFPARPQPFGGPVPCKGPFHIQLLHPGNGICRHGLSQEDRHQGWQHTLCPPQDRAAALRLEPDIRRIIDRYADSSEVYVFPILKTEEPAKAYSQYQVALNYYNRQLKRLTQMLHLDCGLTSYVARHSWATAARNHNVPVSVISAAMGHQSEKTTQIYLAMLENSVIDSANKEIISCLR